MTTNMKGVGRVITLPRDPAFITRLREKYAQYEARTRNADVNDRASVRVALDAETKMLILGILLRDRRVVEWDVMAKAAQRLSVRYDQAVFDSAYCVVEHYCSGDLAL